MPKYKKNFQEALKGSDYEYADFFWVDKAMNHLSMIASIIDEDKKTPEKLPNGKNNPDSLVYKLNEFIAMRAGFGFSDTEKARKPKYKFVGNFPLTFITTYNSDGERKKSNTEYQKVRKGLQNGSKRILISKAIREKTAGRDRK